MDRENNSSRWLGIDVGGTKILGAMMRGDLQVLGKLKVETFRDEGPDAVCGRIEEVCRELLHRHGPVAGVGAGFAGLVDSAAGRVSSSVMLPGWDGFPLAGRLSDALGGLPVLVDNDATSAGYGEYLALGSPPGLNMVLLTVGTGIGGAIVIDGRLYRGAGGFSAEFGNTTIDWRGKRCWCGSFGCLNMSASGSAISARAAELAANSTDSPLRGLASPIPVERVGEAARAGDGAASRAIEEGARALGAGVANIINILNPHRVVITGGVSILGEDYFRWVREEAAHRAFAESVSAVCIEPSVLGAEGGAVGAAGLARDRFAGRC